MGNDNVISNHENAHTARLDPIRPLTNHQVDPHLQERRLQLMQQWGDDKIINSSLRGAILTLIYATLGKRYLKEAIGSGRCVFYWDRVNVSLLHLKRLEGPITIDYSIIISPEGLLSIDDPSFKNNLFKTPQEVLDGLTYQTHIVHHRIDIFNESPLDYVLKGSFNSQCQLFYPPEYPPLLVHIAMNNNDYITSAAVLRHPFIDDPSLPRKDNFRLAHLLELTISNAIIERHLSFLEYLFDEYDILASQTYPFKMAILSNRQEIAKNILKKLPQKLFLKAFQEGFLAAADGADPKLLNWLLKTVPQEMLFPPSVFSPQFLANIFSRFGVETFNICVNRLHIDISWGLLLPELISRNCSPKSYLPLYLHEHKTLNELSTDTKVKIILQDLALEETSSDVQLFLNIYFPLEHHQLLSEVLLNSLTDPNKVKKLLNLGAIVSKAHFEKFLQVFDNSEESRYVFTRLLNSISDLPQAKNDLLIGSAFGENCVKEIFEKFPALTQDEEFLTQFFSEMWKGSIVATDRILSEILSEGRSVSSLQNSKFDQESPLNFIDPTLGSEISTDILAEVLLPRNQINQIRDVLQKRPECIYEFWWKSIFSGYSEFDNLQWIEIISSTFTSQFLTDYEIEKLIGDAIYYSHMQLVSGWLKQLQAVRPAIVIEWYDKALKSGNVEVVAIFAENKLVDHRNEAGESFLHLAVKYNLIDFTSALLKCGLNPNLSDNTGMTPITWAIEHNYLSICCLLDKEGCFNNMIARVLAMTSEEADQWLFRAYLNSECNDLREFMSLLRVKVSNDQKEKALIEIFNQLETFMTTCGAFIVRFPTPFYQDEVHGGYGPAFATYEEQQQSWGMECERHYQTFLNVFKEQDLAILEIFMKLAEVQPKISRDSWRMGVEASLITHYLGRYFMFWRLAQKMYKEFLKRPEHYLNELNNVPSGYQVLYKLNESTIVPLSTIEIRKPFNQGNFEPRMIHTGFNEVKLMLPHLNILFNEIKHFPMPIVKPVIPPIALKRKIAKLFWLGCHLTITSRGSSQYMLLFHRYLYNLHGYSSQSWGLRYVQPDCIAIMMPFEVFFKDYYDFL
ncbi:MAG: ankyrin repeat domain-containing protein [Parachlamydiaceae bacterium]|nr:ankyrin repeat domain-containing protein [Parachlamydiaceae bacterium]